MQGTNGLAAAGLETKQQGKGSRKCASSSNSICQVQAIHQRDPQDLGEHDAEPVWERHCIFTRAWSKLSGNWQGALIPHMPSAQLNPSLWTQQRMCRIPTLYPPDRRGSFPRMQALKRISLTLLPITNAVEKWGPPNKGALLTFMICKWPLPHLTKSQASANLNSFPIGK